MRYNGYIFLPYQFVNQGETDFLNPLLSNILLVTCPEHFNVLCCCKIKNIGRSEKLLFLCIYRNGKTFSS